MKIRLKKEGEIQIYEVDQDSVTMGYVVIDSMVAGRSSGGMRMIPRIDESEMRGLARNMTLKYGFLGLPQGGAKACVIGDSESTQDERRLKLESFGKAVSELLRTQIYVPYNDVGTNNSDIRNMLQAVGVADRRRDISEKDSGYYTAFTVAEGAKRAMAHLGSSISGATVAIEGFGKVGRPLAEVLAAAGARIVAVSTSRGAIYNPRGLDIMDLGVLSAKDGSRAVELYQDAEHIDLSALLELPVDLLSPCALNNTIHAGNAPLVRARVICPGANNPLTAEAESLLAELGILSLPDFVTNCGGVLGGTMAFASIRRAQIEAFIKQHIGEAICWLLKEADRQRKTPLKIAEVIALKRFDEIRQEAVHPTLFHRIFNFGLDVYRRGWIPGRLMADLSLPYFEKCLATTPYQTIEKERFRDAQRTEE